MDHYSERDIQCESQILCVSMQVSHLRLTIGLGNTLDLISLLNSSAVGGLGCAVDDFVGQTFRDGLDVSEGGVTCTLCDQVDGLIDTSQGRDVD